MIPNDPSFFRIPSPPVAQPEQASPKHQSDSSVPPPTGGDTLDSLPQLDRAFVIQSTGALLGFELVDQHIDDGKLDAAKATLTRCQQKLMANICALASMNKVDPIKLYTDAINFISPNTHS